MKSEKCCAAAVLVFYYFLAQLLHPASSIFVSDESEILSALSSNDVILELTNDIYLNATVPIFNVSNIVINGNGYFIDGLNQTQCISVRSSTTIHLNDLIITNGGEVNFGGKGGLIYISDSISVTLTRCTITNGFAVTINTIYLYYI
jgi:hypothetical protein